MSLYSTPPFANQSEDERRIRHAQLMYLMGIAPPGGGTGGGPVASFFAPLMTTLVPTTAGNPTFTFARAALAYAMDFEGILRQAQFGEARFQGARRVRNWLVNTENLTAAGGWTLSNTTSVVGAVDPLGGTTAYTVVATAAGGLFYRDIAAVPPFASNTTTISGSLWIKRLVGVGAIGLQLDNSGGATAIASAITTNWQRIALPAYLSSGNAVRFLLQLGTSGDAIAVWHPQWEAVEGQSNQAPSEYVSVGVLAAPYHGNAVDGVKYFATRNGNSVAANVVTEAAGTAIPLATTLGYVAENAATNIVQQSQTFDVTWTRDNLPIVANDIAAPDGTLTADRLTDNAVSGDHRIYEGLGATLAAINTFSIYAKAGTLTWIQLGFRATATDCWANFNLATGALGNKGAAATSAIVALPNGWYRCSITVPADATLCYAVVYTSNANVAAANPSYVGTGQTMYLWGAQVEQASDPSSYIPTTTGPGSRAQDALNYQAATNVVDTVGTAYAEALTTAQTVGSVVRGVVGFGGIGAYAISAFNTTVIVFDGTSFIQASSIAQNAPFKAASRWGLAGNKSIVVNGGVVASQSFDGSMNAAQIFIGCLSALSETIKGTVRNVNIYSTALTDAQLIALTTIPIPDPIFFAPLTSSLVPTVAGNPTPTFNRNITAYVLDNEDVLRQATYGEARFQGARRVKNLIGGNSTNAQTPNWTVNGASALFGAVGPTGALDATTITANSVSANISTYALTFQSQMGGHRLVSSLWLRRRTGSGACSILDANATPISVLPLTSTWQRFAVGLNVPAGGSWCSCGFTMSVPGDQVDVAYCQVEDVSGAVNQAPGEYVSVGALSAPWNGAGVDGVRYFDTTNGNSIAGNVVTEAPGVAIPTAKLLGYVAENAATNLLPQSQTFDVTAAWSADNGTVAANDAAAPAPDGTITADRYTDNATSGLHRIYQLAITFTAATVYTFSVYAKGGTLPWIQVGGANTSSFWANFNLQTGAIGNKAGSSTASIVALPNGWYRCSVTFTAAGGAGNVQLYGIITDQNNANPTYAGTGQTMFLWGAQVEQRAFATSYIPTTTGAVSRVGDILNWPLATNGDGAVGTAYAEALCGADANDGQSKGIVTFEVTGSYPLVDGARQILSYDGTSVINAANQHPQGSQFKCATRWGVAGRGVCLNGGAVATGTFDGLMNGTLLQIGNWASGSQSSISGPIRNVKIWNTALIDPQLQKLTGP